MHWRRMDIASKSRSFAQKLVKGLKARYFWIAVRIFKGVVNVYNAISKEAPITAKYFSAITDNTPHTVRLQNTPAPETPTTATIGNTLTSETPISITPSNVFSPEVGGV